MLSGKPGRKKYLKIFVFLMLSSSGNFLFGQDQAKQVPSFNERFFFGGNIGLQFGSISDIEVSPVAGYWVLPRLAVAIGPEYRFYKYFRETTHIYGAKAYTEFTVLRNINSVIPIGSNTDILLHAEDSFLSLESDFFKDPPFDNNRFVVNTILGGGGISQQIGKRSYLTLLVLWTLDSHEYGLYSNPDFRISFMF